MELIIEDLFSLPYYPYPDIIFIVILLLLSALFSCSETALTAASKGRMHALAKGGNLKAKLVNRLLKDKEKLIGTILFGNNLVNVLSSALATKLLLEYFGDAGIAYATIIMTFVILIFSEVMPKTYAFHHADSTALKIAPIIQLLLYILRPFTIAIAWIVRRLMRLLGASPGQSLHQSEEELRGAIELHDDGHIDAVKDERAMLHSILDLDNVTVDRIMKHRKNVESISVDQSIQQIVDQVLKSPFSRFPLWKSEPDNIIGTLNAKTLLREIKIAEKEQTLQSLNIMKIAMPPWFIPDTTTLYDQLKAFRHKKEHFALVVDEYSAFMGVVTLEDILEEIVGDIDDELDVSVKGVTPNDDGSYIVDGTVTIRDLNREFDWQLPDDEAATIAGLILHEAQQLPKIGQSFYFYGFRFDILNRHRHQITKIKMTPPQQTD